MAQKGLRPSHDRAQEETGEANNKTSNHESAPEHDIPSAIATFKGSLVSNHLRDVLQRKPRVDSRVASCQRYFSDGWADIGIWKSAVNFSLSFLNTSRY